MKKRKFNRIKTVLAQKKVKAKELAIMLGINERTVSNWCNNTTQPTIITLFKIAIALNMEAKNLLS
jgi:putative transcriptional regulator